MDFWNFHTHRQTPGQAAVSKARQAEFAIINTSNPKEESMYVCMSTYILNVVQLGKKNYGKMMVKTKSVRERQKSQLSILKTKI